MTADKPAHTILPQSIQPVPDEEPSEGVSTLVKLSDFSLARNGPLYAQHGGGSLDSSGSAARASNSDRKGHIHHVKGTGPSESREYAFTMTQAQRVKKPNESAQASYTPPVGRRGQRAPGSSVPVTTDGGVTAAPSAPLSLDNSLATTSALELHRAKVARETQHDGCETNENETDGRKGASSCAATPVYPASDSMATRRLPVLLHLRNAAASTSSLPPRTSVRVRKTTSPLSSDKATGVWTENKSQVAITNETPPNLTPARHAVPFLLENTKEEATTAGVGRHRTETTSNIVGSVRGKTRGKRALSNVVPGQFVEQQSVGSKEQVPAAVAETVSTARQVPKHEVRKSQPVEKHLAQQGPDLSKQETQHLVNPEALAQKVRKFVGLRAGSNLHLETQKLIEKNCDISTFGPAYCASKANPHAEELLWSLEHRKNTTCFVVALFTLAFGVLVQTLIRLLEDRISQGKDEFSKELMETAFRQIATISIVNVILWGVMQSNVASVLDQLIFGDVIPKERDTDAVLENVSPMLEVLFEELFFVAVILLVWYVLYVLIFQCVTRQLIDWMRRVDEESDIPEVARQAEIQRKRCCGWLLGRKAIDKANFIAHRYEFGDNVQAMSVPGVDPTGYYFMEYLRAALLRMAIEMIRLPNSTLIFLMFVGVCLRPFLSFRLSQEAALISVLAAGCLLGMLLVWAYVYRIERQLRPRHIPQYLVLRYHMDVGGHSDSYVEQFTPPYKLSKQKDTWPGLMSLLYGTTLPNKHQQLFCFWANGPALVLRALEATFFCQLLVLAWWVQLIRNHPATWLRYCWWGNIIVGACALTQFGLLENVVYTVLVALNSGLLIEPELLEKVWDMQRAENMRLIVELTDALRVQSTLYAINEGGDIFWRQLLIRSKSAPRQAQEQRLSIWAGLDEEHKGEIKKEKVFRYLSSQGLPVKSEDVSDFLQVFDRDGKGGLNEDEFFVLVMIVKQMLMEPLDKDALRALFENEYGIPWTSPVGIDMPTLSKILNRLHLVWSEGKKRYLFDFVGGRRGTTSVSPDQFVTSLQAMDEQAMQPFQADITGRHAEGERFA